MTSRDIMTLSVYDHDMNKYVHGYNSTFYLKDVGSEKAVSVMVTVKK